MFGPRREGRGRGRGREGGGEGGGELAACEDCERRINSFEQPIQKTVFHTTRIRMNVRRKRRKRTGDSLTFMATVGGINLNVELPIDRVPRYSFYLSSARQAFWSDAAPSMLTSTGDGSVRRFQATLGDEHPLT